MYICTEYWHNRIIVLLFYLLRLCIVFVENKVSASVLSKINPMEQMFGILPISLIVDGALIIQLFI